MESEETVSSDFYMSSDEEKNEKKAAEIEKKKAAQIEKKKAAEIEKKKANAILRKKTLTLGEVSDEEDEEDEEDEQESAKEEAERSKDDEQDGDKKEDKDANMRAMYWAVVHEAQKDIKKANPELSGREVLKRARKVYFDCIVSTNNM